MPTATKIEYVMGELVSEDGKKEYTPKLKLMIKEMYVDEEVLPAARTVAECELTSGMVIEDGDYILRYTFDSQQEEHRVRVENGILLAGYKVQGSDHPA